VTAREVTSLAKKKEAASATSKARTAVKKCSCVSEYQDARYGRGNRLMNRCGSKTSEAYRCTVCAKEQ
jgi:hypothetical protein